MYRWFLRHFPRGGSYADIHHAPIDGAVVSLSASRGRCVSWRKILVIAGAFCSGIYKPLFYLR